MAERLTLFQGGVIYTVDTRRPRATWFTVLGDRFQLMGDGLPPPAPRAVDLGGRCVVPGFVDAHTHFFQTGIDRLHTDVSGARSLDDLGDLLRARAPGGRRSWIIAHSFEEDRVPGLGALTREHLDHLFPQRPVWVNRIDYHSAVVNSAALRHLEVPDGADGLVRAGDGQPNGILRAHAYFHAKARIARLTSIETRERAVREAAAACVPHGITAVHALEGGRIFGDEGVAVLLRKMDTAPLDITLFLQEKEVWFTKHFGFEHLGGCILVDGSIGSYTAALDQDYEGLPGVRGKLYERPRELFAFVDEAHRAGCQLAFHAIGPRAIELVLRAYERALARTPRWDHRHRIEHFELATDDQIRRAVDLGVVASMQPAFEHFWGGPHGMYAARIGERWRLTNRLRTCLDGGLVVAGGSDTNVTPPDPLLGIHAAVNHPNEEQRVTVEEALRMFTWAAAFAGRNDARHGTIAPGKEASFTVLDRDLLATPAQELRDVRVLETWTAGRRVWAV
ncbi:MAG: amidohydrolase [Myxococcales bacterium]